MEDKQVYTTARSEEIKRQFKTYQKTASTWLAKQRKKKKSPPIVPKAASPTPTPIIKEVPSTPIPPTKKPDFYGSLYEEDLAVKHQDMTKVIIPGNTAAEDRLRNVIVYTLLGLIVAIIVFGVFLTYWIKI